MSAERRCDEVTQVLIEGVRPADDAAFAAHVGTCLRCFRVASDLRELPHLESLLHEGVALDDPGERFWAAFPARVAAAAFPAPSRWRRLLEWLRSPVPAALAGAAASALLVLAAVHHRRVPGPVGQAPAARLALDEAAVDELGEELAITAMQGVDEADDEEALSTSWTSLDLRELQALASRLGKPSRAPASADEGTDSSVYDDLESLGNDELRVLSKALGGRRGRI